ncbi:hypothetical protein ACOKFD_00625 [Flagellimonas sp. S174]|uniref:hypothetical protein n=1 Tax=Flagellimonas sp. S174 TaxID=3410790 RepID=UPI003BF52E64
MKSLTILLLSIALFSCKNENKKEPEKNVAAQMATENSPVKKTIGKGTYLCKINGKDWYYTSASSVVAKNENIGFRRATITFKKKLNKGTESIQIAYNADEQTVVSALVSLKPNDINGNLISAMYNMRLGYVKPSESMSGTIDLSDMEAASGTAKITIENDYEKAKLNPEDHILKITDLSFSGVGYSDINREFDKYKK